LPQPIFLETGQEFTFTIKRGVGTDTCVSVNYDDFVNDVEAGDMLLVDGTWMFFCPLISDYLLSCSVTHNCAQYVRTQKTNLSEMFSTKLQMVIE
jgi:pyruvate kinase